MEKIRFWSRNLSLRRSMMLYVLIFAGIAFGFSALTGVLCNAKAEKIRSDYPVIGEKYYLTSEDGERLGEGTYIGKMTEPMSESDARLVSVLELIPMAAVPVYAALCIIGAALMFYRNKLQRPLEILEAASAKISENDLNFSVEYPAEDELGQLCASFETMRVTLAGNFSEMWRQVDERKQLNAAFAHELRTPLTVLKGYNEMLQSVADARIRDTAATMGKHISRMEAYIDGMSRMRRLEDTQPEYEKAALDEFLTSLTKSADILCGQKNRRLTAENRTFSEKLVIDRGFVTQVFDNLVSNSLRYAASCLTVLFEEKDQGLLVCVGDDGPGFSGAGMRKALNPYFTEEEKGSGHFGLGLYISRILCEHHGGYLKIKNTKNGACIEAFFKVPDCR